MFKFGISFICRIKNEEANLEANIKSLLPITISYEIIIVLNNCTDGSEPIAMKYAEQYPDIVKVHHYDIILSRPGYENLVTDTDSPHSLSSYYNFCFGKRQYQWVMKWDGDFIASPSLIEFINTYSDFTRDCQEATIIRIAAVNSDSRNFEPYLFNCLLKYNKYIFWEIPTHTGLPKTIDLPHEIHHNSLLKDMKSYWLLDPWFFNDDSPEANTLKSKYQYLVDRYGSEPRGACRASNPECDSIFMAIRCDEQHLAEAGIHLQQ